MRVQELHHTLTSASVNQPKNTTETSPEGKFTNDDEGIKRKRKKVRSKRKNLRKDSRPGELKPGGASYTGTIQPRKNPSIPQAT
jgi:hypothetical protein